jgi:hypothetical protein
MSNQKTTPKKQDHEEEKKKRRDQIQRQMRFSLGFLVTSLIALWLFQEFILTPLVTQAAEIPYSEF